MTCQEIFSTCIFVPVLSVSTATSRRSHPDPITPCDLCNMPRRLASLWPTWVQCCCAATTIFCTYVPQKSMVDTCKEHWRLYQVLFQNMHEMWMSWMRMESAFHWMWGPSSFLSWTAMVPEILLIQFLDFRDFWKQIVTFWTGSRSHGPVVDVTLTDDDCPELLRNSAKTSREVMRCNVQCGCLCTGARFVSFLYCRQVTGWWMQCIFVIPGEVAAWNTHRFVLTVLYCVCRFYEGIFSASFTKVLFVCSRETNVISSGGPLRFEFKFRQSQFLPSFILTPESQNKGKQGSHSLNEVLCHLAAKIHLVIYSEANPVDSYH